MKIDNVENLVQESLGAITPKPDSTTSTPVNVVESGRIISASISRPPKASDAPSTEQIKAAVNKMNDSLTENGFTLRVQFVLDPGSERMVVQVVEPKTQELVRQIPSEEAIQLSMVVGKKLGQLISQRA